MSFLLNGCFFYKEVKITNIRNVELVKFENNAIIIEADVDVFNPNFYDIEVVDSQLKIYLDGEILGNAKILASNSFIQAMAARSRLEVGSSKKMILLSVQ